MRQTMLYGVRVGDRYGWETSKKRTLAAIRTPQGGEVRVMPWPWDRDETGAWDWPTFVVYSSLLARRD